MAENLETLGLIHDIGPFLFDGFGGARAGAVEMGLDLRGIDAPWERREIARKVAAYVEVEQAHLKAEMEKKRGG